VVGNSIIGVVIAGGKGLRLGGREKTLLEINNKAILSHIIDTASPQVDQLLLNSNSNASIFSGFNLPIIKDENINAASPLLGIYSSLLWIEKNNVACDWLMSFPGDCPFFPRDIVETLHDLQQTQKNTLICTVKHEQQIQPLFSLWSTKVREPLKNYLEADKRSAQGFILSHPHVVLELNDKDFQKDQTEKNSKKFFININTKEDLEKAQS